MISQMTPAGGSPAIRARSTAASVCPARTSTPPSRARSGNMWPGRARSAGFVAGSTAARTVAARSAAEMPVVVRRFASIDTVKAVPNDALFSVDHQGKIERVEPLARHGQADQTAAVLGHEVDRLGRDLLGGHRQIALVLPILIVDHDDHLTGANGVDGRPRPGRRGSGTAGGDLQFLGHVKVWPGASGHGRELVLERAERRTCRGRRLRG